PLRILRQRIGPYDVIRAEHFVAGRRCFRIFGNEDDIAALERASLDNGYHRAPEQEPLAEDQEWSGYRKRQYPTAREVVTDLQRKADAKQEEKYTGPDEYQRRNLRANG